jgi:hypothetical protein
MQLGFPKQSLAKNPKQPLSLCHKKEFLTPGAYMQRFILDSFLCILAFPFQSATSIKQKTPFR